MSPHLTSPILSVMLTLTRDKVKWSDLALWSLYPHGKGPPPGSPVNKGLCGFQCHSRDFDRQFFGTARSRTKVPLSLKIVSLTLNQLHRPSSSALEIRNAHLRPCMHRENYMMRSFVICTPYPIFCGW